MNLKNFEQLNQMALSHVSHHRFDDAIKLYRCFLSDSPGHTGAQLNFLRVLLRIGELDQALKLAQTIPFGSRHAVLNALCGQVFLSTRHYSAASAAIEAALQFRPDDASLLLMLSEALIGGGRLDEAISLLKRLAVRFPNEREPFVNLAIAYSESGRLDDAKAVYLKLIDKYPADLLILANACRFFLHSQNLVVADQLISKFVDCDTENLDAQLLKAELMQLSADNLDVVSQWTKLYRAHPADLRIVVPFVYSLLANNDLEAVRECLHSFMSASSLPFDTRLWSLLCDLPESLQLPFVDPFLLRPENVVASQQIFPSADNDLELLTDYVLNSSSLVDNRVGKPTDMGLQSHELLDSGHPCAVALRQRIAPLVSDYLSHHSQHPLLAHLQHKSSSTDQSLHCNWRWSGWGVALRSGGRQRRHTHPESFLSGVLYLQVPDSVVQGSDGQGSLQFTHSIYQDLDNQTPFTIKPYPGLVVLFPSYLPHETSSFVSEQQRVCIAFNIA